MRDVVKFFLEPRQVSSRIEKEISMLSMVQNLQLGDDVFKDHFPRLNFVYTHQKRAGVTTPFHIKPSVTDHVKMPLVLHK